MRYFSMFSGIGGFEKGIEQAFSHYQQQSQNSEQAEREERAVGRERDSDKHEVRVHASDDSASCAGFSEINKHAIAIYKRQFPGHRNYGSATDIVPEDLPDFDLLVGGFPCQAFSIAGKRRGLDDARGTLFFEIARVLEAKRPRAFLLENVKGLFSSDDGRTFRTIIRTLTDLGYCVEWDCLNSKNYGVPQNRERVFIVGHLGGIPGREVFPLGDCYEEVDEAIGINVVPVLTPDRPEKRQNGRRFKEDGEPMFTLTGQDKHGVMITGVNRPSRGIEPRKDGLAATIKSGESGTQKPTIMNFKTARIRRLTPLECERLQGFSDNWTQYGDYGGEIKQVSDTQRYKCIGNAVSVPVIEAIIRKMIEATGGLS